MEYFKALEVLILKNTSEFGAVAVNLRQMQRPKVFIVSLINQYLCHLIRQRMRNKVSK